MGKRRAVDNSAAAPRAAELAARKRDVELAAVAKLLAQPLRVEILRRLQASDGPRSPVQLAREMQVPLGTVAYHVRVLADAKALELAEEVPRRGAFEHRYALVAPERMNTLVRQVASVAGA